MNFKDSKIGTYMKVSYLIICTGFLIEPGVISYSKCHFSRLYNSPFLVEVFISFPFCIQISEGVFKFFKTLIYDRYVGVSCG